MDRLMQEIEYRTIYQGTASQEERIQARLAIEHRADCNGYERREIHIDFLLLGGLKQDHRGFRLSINWSNISGQQHYLHLLGNKYESLKPVSGRWIDRKKTIETDYRVIQTRSDNLRRLIPLIGEREVMAREANRRVVMDRNLDWVVQRQRKSWFRMEPNVSKFLYEFYNLYQRESFPK